MTVTEQFSATQKSNFETFFSLGSKVFSSVEKLAELNLQAAKTLLSEAQETMRAALSVKDLHELIALQAGWLKSAGEKAAAYRHHVHEIAASTRADFTKAAEVSTKETQDKILAAVDAAAKNAPAGSENAVALVKASLEGANSAYEELHKAAKHATDAAETNFSNITDSTLKSSQAIVNKTKRVEA